MECGRTPQNGLNQEVNDSLNLRNYEFVRHLIERVIRTEFDPVANATHHSFGFCFRPARHSAYFCFSRERRGVVGFEKERKRYHWDSKN